MFIADVTVIYISTCLNVVPFFELLLAVTILGARETRLTL